MSASTLLMADTPFRVLHASATIRVFEIMCSKYVAGYDVCGISGMQARNFFGVVFMLKYSTGILNALHLFLLDSVDASGLQQ
jgi:hypothetical protein